MNSFQVWSVSLLVVVEHHISIWLIEDLYPDYWNNTGLYNQLARRSYSRCCYAKCEWTCLLAHVHPGLKRNYINLSILWCSLVDSLLTWLSCLYDQKDRKKRRLKYFQLHRELTSQLSVQGQFDYIRKIKPIYTSLKQFGPNATT